MSDSQEHRRHQAIARYLAGDRIEAICRDLNCAKSWLYKWQYFGHFLSERVNKKGHS
jgi:transposase